MDKEPLSYTQTELFAETGSEKQGEVELRNPCRSHEANRDGRQAGRYRSGLRHRWESQRLQATGCQEMERGIMGNRARGICRVEMRRNSGAGRRKAGTVMWKHASPAVYWLCGSSQGGAHSCDINMHIYSFFLSSGPRPRDRFWNLEKVSM